MACNPQNKIDPRDLLPLDQKCQMWLEITKARTQVRELQVRIEYLVDRLKLNDEKFGSIDINKLYETKEQEEYYK
jgi:urocanate hydratase